MLTAILLLPGASISSRVLIHPTARTSCASHQAIRSGRSVGRLSPLPPIPSLSPQPRQCLHMAVAPLVVLSLLTSGEGLGCALYPGMLPALSINPAPLPDGELMLQMWSVPCHYLTSPKGYSQGDALEGNSLFRLQRPGEAPVVCLLQDAAVQEGINAEGFGSLVLLAESRWKRGFTLNVRF